MKLREKLSIDKMWADFYEWPERWKGFPEDVPFSERVRINS